LNVFPITVPPRRERGDDVILLASALAARFAERMGRTIEPLSNADGRRLRAYHWPGNVRELQNVMERAVITSRDGRLNLERALPDAVSGAVETSPAADAAPSPDARIYTAAEWQDLERHNILGALQACGGKVAGRTGAAARLGLKPSTLASRMKALGISRPPAE
jgi:transcriptional regulator with GAF, ATPase, and Fis domain